MITKLELISAGSVNPIRMDIVVPKADTKFLVTNINGLTPVKADIATSGLVQIDGESFDYARVGSRNIVIEFEYTPNYALGQTAESLRLELYKVASPRMEVTVSLDINNTYNRKITGYVESIESPMFSKEIKGQISILCPQPYFRDALQVLTLSSGSNQNIYYQGDVPCGVHVVSQLPASINSFDLRNTHGGVLQRLHIQSSSTSVMGSGNSVEVKTIDGEKFARTYSPGINLVPYMTSYNWWKLTPGTAPNVIRLYIRNFSDVYLTSNYTLYYTPLYGGL